MYVQNNEIGLASMGVRKAAFGEGSLCFQMMQQTCTWDECWKRAAANVSGDDNAIWTSLS